MNKVFEVGKEYYCADSGFAPIKILKRTAKMVFVDNGACKWRMRIRLDKNGDECVVDSLNPVKYRDTFTYMASKEVEEFEAERERMALEEGW